jgi:hypothetical protein
VTNSLFVVVNTIDKRTGAQKLFNNVNATGIPLTANTTGGGLCSRGIRALTPIEPLSSNDLTQLESPVLIALARSSSELIRD